MRQGELTLDQMLADPIVRLLMRRDGVEEADVRMLMARLHQQRAARTWSATCGEVGLGPIDIQGFTARWMRDS